MAIEYTLKIATSWSAEAVAAEVLAAGQPAGIFGASETVRGLLAGDVGTRLGTWVRVMRLEEEAESRASWDPVVNTFGFTPTVSVLFRYNKFDDFDAQGDDMIRITSRLLERVPGDLILWMWESERIWLLRRGGDLSLNEQNMWTPRRLAMITQPYRRATAIIEDP